jgi:hypothetical protein
MGAVGDIESNVIKPPSRAPSTQGLIKMCPPVSFQLKLRICFKFNVKNAVVPVSAKFLKVHSRNQTNKIQHIQGGEIFLTAWQMTCGMKKRRKRSTYMRPGKPSSTNL